MEYLILRYRVHPGEIVDLVATGDPGTAVSLVRRWSHRALNEGLVVLLEDEPIVHCTPQSSDDT